MAKPIPINEVPMNKDPLKQVAVFNPLAENFTCLIASRPVTVPAGEAILIAEPYAEHIALHLADKICRERQNQFLLEKFPGLDERGMEKWRTQVKVYSSQEDKEAVKQQLLLDPSVLMKKESLPASVEVADPKVAVEPTDILATKPGESPKGDSAVNEINARKNKDIKVTPAVVETATEPAASDEETEEVVRPRRSRRA